MKDLKETILFFLIFLIFLFNLDSQDFLQKGEDLFMQNKPEEALDFFKAANEQDPANENVYIYLGIIYEQLGKRDEALKILRKGLESAKEKKEVFYYNIANNLFALNQNTFAEDMYSRSIHEDSSYFEAYLNRAQVRMRLENYDGALTDYKLYLTLSPFDGQRAQIEKMINALKLYLKDLEVLKVEQDKVQQAELARQKALLSDVLNSLNNASDDTTNISADTENITDYEFESDIED